MHTPHARCHPESHSPSEKNAFALCVCFKISRFQFPQQRMESWPFLQTSWTICVTTYACFVQPHNWVVANMHKVKEWPNGWSQSWIKETNGHKCDHIGQTYLWAIQLVMHKCAPLNCLIIYKRCLNCVVWIVRNTHNLLERIYMKT